MSATSTTTPVKKEMSHLPKSSPIKRKEEKQRKLIIYMKSISKEEILSLKMSF